MTKPISRKTQELYDEIVAHSITSQDRALPPVVRGDRGGIPARMPSHDAAVAGPVRWMNQPEVDNLSELLEEILGTTFRVRRAARALLNETQGNYLKLHKILIDYKSDRKFCDWAQRAGLRAFAFKEMVLTRFHATAKRAARKDWYERNREHMNR